MAAKKGGLGRGFDSLFSDNSVEERPVSELRLSQIVPDREQPRKTFDDEALAELCESIREHGLIQPVIVCPDGGGAYRIIAGERRWRASRMAGLDKIPVIIRDVGPSEAKELALIENLQREDLNPVEEAEGYKALMDACGYTQEEVAGRVGKSRPAVANALRLLALNKEELEALKSGIITPGHARALLAISDPERRAEAFRLAKEGATVREIEAAAKHGGAKTKSADKPRYKFYIETEAALSEQIGRKAKIRGNGKHGTITLEFFDDDDLADIASKLAGVKKR